MRIKDEDYKYSMKKLVKSKELDDLLLVLEYNIDDKVATIIAEPNVQNLWKHKVELALYQNMLNQFTHYRDNSDLI